MKNMLISQYPLLAFLVHVPLAGIADVLTCGYSEILNNVETRYVDVRLDITNEQISSLFIKGSIVPGRVADVDACYLDTSEKNKVIRLARNVELVTNSNWSTTNSTTTGLVIKQVITKDGSPGENYQGNISFKRTGNVLNINLEKAPMKMCNMDKGWPLEVFIEIGNEICKVRYRK